MVWKEYECWEWSGDEARRVSHQCTIPVVRSTLIVSVTCLETLVQICMVYNIIILYGNGCQINTFQTCD